MFFNAQINVCMHFNALYVALKFGRKELPENDITVRRCITN